MSAFAKLAPGSVFAGDFRVDRVIAEGPRSAVYSAEQLSTGAQRALKIMHPDLVEDAALRERFPRDARMGARIWSDHVVEVVAAGVDDPTGLPFLAMELLEGADLAKHVASRGHLPPAEVSVILGQVCHALVAAHTAGITHRRLAPESIFLAKSRRPGEPPIVKVLGFGLGKLVAESKAAPSAPSPWSAPEEATSGASITPAADLWSLGLVAFFLLTGRPFWSSASGEPAPTASQRARDLGCGEQIPTGFDAWFARCVARDPAARFGSPGEAQAELDRIVGAGAALSAGQGPAPAAIAATAAPAWQGPSPVGPAVPAWGAAGQWAGAPVTRDPRPDLEGGPPAPGGPYRGGRPAAPARRAKPLSLGLIVAFLAAGAAIVAIAMAAIGVAVFEWDRFNKADIAKTMIALAAATFALADTICARVWRPAPGWLRKAIGIPLGIAAIIAYFNGFSFGYPKYYHRWDQYHHYVGAKYFPELGYDGLYRCAVIAQDELGVVKFKQDGGRAAEIDMSKEVRNPAKKIRNLEVDNLLMPAASALERPEVCKARFSPERWERFKADVSFFRTESDKSYWEGMQTDQGYRATPVWTVAARLFAELHPASVGYLQLLAMLDLVYLLAMFAALWWAFGWRVSAFAAIFWGCQASAPFFWTGGALLRQDWLFYLVFSACLARKRHFKLAGAAIVYAALLRVFPAFVILGWLPVIGAYAVRHRRLAKSHQQALVGGLLAALVLVPVSLGVAGTDAYSQFYKHTFETGEAPLTNHMGLEVLITHDVGGGPGSGRMEHARDSKLLDPFEIWKRMRIERWEKYRFVGYAVIALSIAAFVAVGRRLRSLWIAQCLGQVFIVLMTRITCFHYSFMVIAAPLTRAARWLEVPLFAFVALSQVVWVGFKWNDDRYTALTAISLLLCYGLVAAFARFGRRKAAAARTHNAGVTTI